MEDLSTIENSDYMGATVAQRDGKLYFSTDKDTVFVLNYSDLTDDNRKLAINIVQSFFNVSKYRMTSENEIVKHMYYSDIQKDANYKMAIQKGICNWIVGKNNHHVEKLFNILERWSVQTYEGKKVTFGFIVNPKAQSRFGEDYGTWCDFLNDDFSAVLTDCIDSVIELDSSCNFVRYMSLTEPELSEKTEKYTLDDTLPFRFSEIIKRYVVDDAVGVFLLNNGDIIVSKNKAIRFVKRNLTWLNFDFGAFKNSLIGFCDKNNIPENLIHSIFASVLDVSFAHTGGIISIVRDINELTENDPILNSCDYLRNEKSNEKIAEEIRESMKNSNIKAEDAEKEINKRILKRKVITSLVGKKDFISLDRKLRCELIAMDGACILSAKGEVCAFGAIIKNDSGSSGGGRGAASKKLSKYGMAIKISTDGYIEEFIEEKPAYSIK